MTGKLSLTIRQNKSTQGDEFLVDLFQAAGLRSMLEDDMGRWLRSRFTPRLILWGVSRSKFRQTLGNSAAKYQGLIELFATEAGQRPDLREAIDALRALQAEPATQTRAVQRAR